MVKTAFASTASPAMHNTYITIIHTNKLMHTAAARAICTRPHIAHARESVQPCIDQHEHALTAF